MDSRAVIVGCGAALLAGCVATPAPGPTDLSQLGQQLIHTVCPGPPTRVALVPNQHVAGQIDRIEVRSCKKGESHLYVGAMASNPRGLAMSVVVVAPNAGLPHWLEIGQRVTNASRVIGVPGESGVETSTYPLGWDADDTLVIASRAGKITSVQWSWAVD